MAWYTGDPTYDTVLALALALAPTAVVALRFMKAPYGRFGPSGGLAVSARTGWFLMELPATVVFLVFYLSGPRRAETVPLVLASIWGLHYLNRGFLFPALMRVPKNAPRTFGLLTLATGAVVTAVHGYLNGAFFSDLGPHLVDGWLVDPRFGIGLSVYALGFLLNVHSDAVLRGLRTRDEVARGEKVYRVPRGGGYRFVTNPSYLGELIMWTGFAIFTWSLAGVFILAISLANLVPRALSNHRWYLERFEDYPRSRRALIPYLL
ncbi:MAG: methyltransferase [Sandaracinaceae bacterium]